MPTNLITRFVLPRIASFVAEHVAEYLRLRRERRYRKLALAAKKAEQSPVVVEKPGLCISVWLMLFSAGVTLITGIGAGLLLARVVDLEGVQ